MVEPITLQDMADITKINDNFEDVQDQIDNIDLEISNINGRVTNEIARATGVEEILTTQVNNHSLQIATNALNIETKQGTLTAGTGITIDSNNVISASGGGGGGDDLLVEVTYSELKTMRDGLQLVPGQQYRITDFTTIINGDVTVSGTTKTLYRSANHPFDLIVTADSSNTLNENARAIQHSGDTYFASQNLKAWQLKYCLDNNTTRFNWANTSTGKGVIFYLKDERDNECGYDFKNIQMKRFKITAVDLTARDVFSLGTSAINAKYQTNIIDALVGHYVGAINYVDLTVVQNDIITIDENDFKWFYTFSSASQTDLTLTSGMLKLRESCTILPNNVFHSGTIANVSMQESDCINNTFEGNCYRTFFKGIINNNISVGAFSNNVVGNAIASQIWLGVSKSNLGQNHTANIIGGNNLVLGEYVRNTIYFGSGTKLNYCSYIQTGANCNAWVVETNSSFILAENDCVNNKFGIYCGGSLANKIELKQYNQGHYFKGYNRAITLGQYLEMCEFGEFARSITINNTSTNRYGHISIPSSCSNLTFAQGANYIVVASSQATNLTIDTTWNNKTISGNTYGTATIDSSTGAMSAITNYCYGHKGTAICPDVGIPPTANTMGIGYTCETYETA